MLSFYTNFYGSELWDLGNPSVQDFCIAWRKGLRRVWDLPYTTHGDLLPVLANTIPILDELHRRTANFINNCLSSKCRVVQAIARHGVYFGLMKSPIGRNVFQCCSRYGVRSLAISEVTTFLINKFVHNNINEKLVWKANLILKLIFLKDRSFSLSASLFNLCWFRLHDWTFIYRLDATLYISDFMVPLAPDIVKTIILLSHSFTFFFFFVFCMNCTTNNNNER